MKLRGIVIARFCVAESWRALRSNSPILANPKKSLESVRLLESFMDSVEVSLSVIARKSARIFSQSIFSLDSMESLESFCGFCIFCMDSVELF